MSNCQKPKGFTTRSASEAVGKQGMQNTATLWNGENKRAHRECAGEDVRRGSHRLLSGVVSARAEAGPDPRVRPLGAEGVGRVPRRWRSRRAICVLLWSRGHGALLSGEHKPEGLTTTTSVPSTGRASGTPAVRARYSPLPHHANSFHNYKLNLKCH